MSDETQGRTTRAAVPVWVAETRACAQNACQNTSAPSPMCLLGDTPRALRLRRSASATRHCGGVSAGSDIADRARRNCRIVHRRAGKAPSRRVRHPKVGGSNPPGDALGSRATTPPIIIVTPPTLRPRQSDPVPIAKRLVPSPRRTRAGRSLPELLPEPLPASLPNDSRYHFRRGNARRSVPSMRVDAQRCPPSRRDAGRATSSRAGVHRRAFASDEATGCSARSPVFARALAASRCLLGRWHRARKTR